MIFKKNKKENNNNKKLLLVENKKIKNISLKKFDSYFKKQLKIVKQEKFYNFDEFLEKIEVILLNNQFKEWFNIKKWLFELWKWKYQIYKKLWFIDNTMILEKLLKNEIYKKYSFIFKNTDIKKSIYFVWIAKKLRDIEKKEYEINSWSLKWFNWIFSNLFQMNI